MAEFTRALGADPTTGEIPALTAEWIEQYINPVKSVNGTLPDASGNVLVEGTGGGGTGAVDSVNGRTGTVVLTAADVGAAATSHVHAASAITTGVLNIARIPTGTSGLTVALGNHTHEVSQINGLQTQLNEMKGIESLTNTDGDATATVLYTDGTSNSLPLPPGPVPLSSGVNQPVETNWLWFDEDDPEDQAPGAGQGVLTGIGQPEGVVVASPGAQYLDTVATAGARLWLKVSGEGSATGWICTQGDTGWRNMAVAPYATANSDQFNYIPLRRINERVYMDVSNTSIYAASGVTAGFRDMVTLPLGLRASSTVRTYQGGQIGVSNRRIAIDSSSIWVNTVADTNTNLSPETGLGSLHWLTNDAWPTTMPGEAV